MSGALRPALVSLALAALTAAGFFALTPMGVAGDTQCEQFVVRLVDPNRVCDDAVATRAVWVVVALVLAVAAAAGAVVADRRERARSSGIWPAALLVCLALTALGALRLGFGSTDSCGSAITGPGRYPYDAAKPALCADTYARDRLWGWTELGSAVVVVAAAAGLSGRRARAAQAAPSATA